MVEEGILLPAPQVVGASSLLAAAAEQGDRAAAEGVDSTLVARDLSGAADQRHGAEADPCPAPAAAQPAVLVGTYVRVQYSFTEIQHDRI